MRCQPHLGAEYGILSCGGAAARGKYGWLAGAAGRRRPWLVAASADVPVPVPVAVPCWPSELWRCPPSHQCAAMFSRCSRRAPCQNRHPPIRHRRKRRRIAATLVGGGGDNVETHALPPFVAALALCGQPPSRAPSTPRWGGCACALAVAAAAAVGCAGTTGYYPPPRHDRLRLMRARLVARTQRLRAAA
jgi:hypothetical protein